MVQLYGIIIKIRLRLLASRWWHILIIHRHITMWIIITWIVHIFPRSWWLRWLCRSRCRLIREIQPNIWAPAGSRTFRLIPKNNQRPSGCLHIFQTRKELRHRKEKHMIMITLAPQNDDGVRMTMNQRQCFPVGPPVDLAILKLQVWKCQNSDSFQQCNRQKIVNVSEGLNQRRCPGE